MKRGTALPGVAALVLLLLVLAVRLRAPAEPPRSSSEEPRLDESPGPAEPPATVERATPPRREPSTLEVSVFDPERRPAVGAPVFVVETRSIAELGRCTTDSSGACALSNLPPGEVRAFVRTGKHRPKYSEVLRLAAGETRRVELQLELGRVISGRVLSDEGAPLPGAKVGTSDDGSSLAVTGDDGRFELGGLGAEPVNLFATAEGFAPRQIRAIRPGAAGFDVTMERPSAVNGRVSFGAATSFTVSVCHRDAHFGREICIARQLVDPARADYRIDGLPSGSYDVVIEAPGHHAERARILLRSGETLTAPELSLRAVP